MIKEEYVTCETAKLLKKAGFPQYKSVTEYECCLRPTQAQAMRWLREEKHLNVRVNYSAAYRDWFYDNLNLDTGGYYEDDEYWNSYEAAAEAGIQAACEYLIEKQKGGVE